MNLLNGYLVLGRQGRLWVTRKHAIFSCTFARHAALSIYDVAVVLLATVVLITVLLTVLAVHGW